MTAKSETSKELVPKLRFPEFQGDGGWEEWMLGKGAKILKGKGISKADIHADGALECIRYGELYTKYTEVIDKVFSKTNAPKSDLVLSKEGDIIIPASGETQIDIAAASCVKRAGVALGGDLNIIRSKMYGPFFSYYLNGAKKYEIASKSQGVSVIHLYPEQLKKLVVETPEPAEQQKIAGCLGSLDDLIAAQHDKLAALRDHKKGLLQKLFPAEGQTTPELRFPGFEGEWEERTIGKECKTFSGGTPSSSNKSYYDGNIPFIRSAEIAKNETALFLTQDGLENSAAKMVKIGDVLVALYGANSGDVAISKMEGAINQAILCLRSKSSNAFICYYIMHKKSWILRTFLQGGQGNLSGEIIKSIMLAFPKPLEQQKIADCLSALDDQIAAQSDQIAALQAHKQGLMQQLFPNPEMEKA